MIKNKFSLKDRNIFLSLLNVDLLMIKSAIYWIISKY